MIDKVLKKYLLLLAMATATTTAGAHEGDTLNVVRPATAIFSLDVGGAVERDTYLSPLDYKGLDVRLGYEHLQAAGFAPDRWVRQLDLGVDYTNTTNPAGNHTMHALRVEGQWALMRRWRHMPWPEFQLMAGGVTSVAGGMLYNALNSNNVVSARAHWNVGLAGQAVFNFHIKRLPVTVRYQAIVPVLGVWYSPDYDESYFEMYVGNRSGLAHLGWWGNRFDMGNLLTIDLRLGGTILRLGYRNTIARTRVNGITTHGYRNAFVIGLGGEFLTTGYRRLPSSTSHSVSAIY